MIEQEIKRYNAKEFDENGYTIIGIDQPFKTPEGYIKTDWSKKYNPFRILNAQISKKTN